ncbi:MAG TPA: NfeD family protein [Rickettsiales bacterium]|nr:NfeD family protein [Rickettsiales bacterium]
MIETLISNPAYIWLTFGALLIVLEALTAPGLGLFLGGLGALCTGIIVQAGWIETASTALQFTSFFAFTILWTIALWKPLMKFRASGKGSSGSKYHNMVGDTAIVHGERGLKRGETGQVTWSGAVMNAELDASSAVDSVPAGAQVEIRSVSGNTLKVKPR